jgi:hypothetical protein
MPSKTPTVEIEIPPLRRFRVRICYREPTFEQRKLSHGEPYSATYEIEAWTPKLAARMALCRFHESAGLSSVGWVREVATVEVCAA